MFFDALLNESLPEKLLIIHIIFLENLLLILSI